jgi:pimeloyl-ACP methyl ester carboxylesterase
MWCIKRGVVSILTVIGISASLVVVGSQPAMADPKDICVAELKVKIPNADDAVAKTPVLAVHGLMSSRSTWSDGGTSSMMNALTKIKDVAIVEPFDYQAVNDRWVTDLAIGARLAKFIVCYSLLYTQRPIVVAHSMGGLAAREASSWAAYGVNVRDVIGDFITIGTPHTGASIASVDSDFWLTACKAPLSWLSPSMGMLVDGPCREIESTRATSGMRIDSGQLAKLAAFPAGVPVKAIAGEVSWHACAPWAGCSPPVSTDGDLVVSVSSATKYGTDTGRGDGVKVFKCNTSMPVSPLTDAWCDHNKMLQSPEVQAEVRRSIEQYITSIRGKTADFYGLKLQLGPDWEVHSETSFGRMMIDTLHCTTLEGKKWCSGFTVIDQEAVTKSGPAEGLAIGHCNVVWRGGDMDGYASPPQPKPDALVGGETAQYSEVEECILPGSLARIWLVRGKKLMIASFEFEKFPLSDLDGILKEASWQ